MCRFLYSIPRVFRQHLHGPRASVGVHVDEERNEQNVVVIEKCRGPCFHRVESPLKRETANKSEGFFANWFLQKFQSSYSHGNSSGASQKGNHWGWNKHNFRSFFQGSSNALEAVTVGSAFSWGSDVSRNRRKTPVFYQALFAVLNRPHGLTKFNNDQISPQVHQPNSLFSNNLLAIKDAAGSAHDAAVNSLQKPETLDSAMKDFQNMCTEYTAQSESLLGLEAAQEGKMSEAVTHLHAACSYGNMSACFNLGLCYEIGSGVQQNYQKAEHYYKKASDGGHNVASYNLGLMYLTGERSNADSQGETERGFKFLERAAQHGVTEAQVYLGMHQMQEMGNAEKAVPYFRSAADQNDREAQYLLAVCFEHGLGVEANECRAAQLYSMAASAGHAEAMYCLGVFNENGMGGIPEDHVSAIELYTRAADLGCEDAQKRLNEIKAMDEKDTHCDNRSQTHNISSDSTTDVSLSSTAQKSKCVLSPSASSPCFSGSIDDLSAVFSWDVSYLKSKELPKENCVKVSVSKQVPVHFYIGGSDVESDLLIEIEKNVKNFDMQRPNRLTGLDLENVQPRDFLSSGTLHLHHSHTSPSLSLVSCNF